MPRKSEHPGVKLVVRRRKGGATHYGRVQRIDGSWRDVNLDELGLLTDADRKEWALRESKGVMIQRRAAALGLSSSPREAADRFLRDATARLKESTLLYYRSNASRLVEWLEGKRVSTVDQITPAMLFAYREHVVGLGLKPGTQILVLKSAQLALSYWRRAGLTPQLSSDMIQDNLRGPQRAHMEPVAFRPPELRAILKAGIERGWGMAAPVALVLMLGTRVQELMQLKWSRVDLIAPPLGEIRLTSADTKNKKPRVIDLTVCPTAGDILRSIRERAEAEGRPRGPDDRVIFWRRTRFEVREIPEVLRKHAGVPPGLRWKDLRSTCGTYLTCSPGIWGSSSAYRAARQLGHSVSIAERHYWGVLKTIPSTATCLEEAMEVLDLVDQIALDVRNGPRAHEMGAVGRVV